MTRTRLLGTAAILTAAIATPAMAQTRTYESHAYVQAQPRTNVTHAYNRSSGFWPADVAAGVVGGAIGTAGAIATAPFRGSYYGDPAYHNVYYGGPAYRDSYAYYGGPTYDDSYAYSGETSYVTARRGRTSCGPQLGATYLGPDGRWYPC